MLYNKSMDFFFLKRYDADVIINVVLQLIMQKLPKFVNAQPYDIQVLTPMKKGNLGVERLNAILQRYLNPPAPDKKEKEYGHAIYLIADEPYLEIVYEGVEVSYVPNYYENTFVCYSYSKSLSLPGERIGYIIVPDEMEDSKRVMAAVNGAGRALGFVCAPVLFQRVAAMCADVPSDIAAYARNRDLLYNGLTELGYECVRPQGAFYLFVKSTEPDANAISERAKKHDVLVVPSDSFGCPGYVRISYCVAEKTIVASMPAFKAIMEEVKECRVYGRL